MTALLQNLAPATARPSWLRLVLRLIVAFASAALMLAWVSERVPLWPEVWGEVAWGWMALALACHAPYGFLRGLRCVVLLDRLAERAQVRAASRVSRRAVLSASFLAFWWLWLLPFRLGEAARPLLLVRAKLPGLGWVQATTIAIVERVLDAGAIAGLALLGFAGSAVLAEGRGAPPQASMWLSSLQWVSSLILAAALGVFIGLFFARMLASILASWQLARGLISRLRDLAVDFLQRVGDVADVMRGRELGRLTGQTLLYWAFAVAQQFCLTQACGLDLGWAGAATLIGVVGLALQLPAGPAQLGAQQAGTLVALEISGGHAEGIQITTFIVLAWLLTGLGNFLLGLVGVGLGRSYARANPPCTEKTA